MLLKNHYPKLLFVLLLLLFCPNLSHAYIYDYKNGIRNTMLIGGEAMPLEMDLNPDDRKYTYIDKFGGQGYFYAGAETQFSKYFSLASTLGISVGSVQTLHAQVVSRFYPGIPYLFAGLGAGLEMGALFYQGTNEAHTIYDDHKTHSTYSPFLLLVDVLGEVGFSIPYNKTFSIEITLGTQLSTNPLDSLTGYFGTYGEINLNFKI